MWKLDVWVQPVRHRITGKVLKLGYWIDGGTQPSDKACERELRRLAGTGKTSRAKAVTFAFDGLLPGGPAYSGMSASPSYFARWTGSRSAVGSCRTACCSRWSMA